MNRDFLRGLIAGALLMACIALSACATINASNEYLDVELCAYWEHE